MLMTSGAGILIVFAVLLILMGVITVMNLFMKKKKTGGAPEVSRVVEQRIVSPAPAAAKTGERAKGSCGGVVLNGVEEKTAAMLMAIVADELKTPLCELRFISVKEV